MRNFLIQLVAGVLGLWLAVIILPQVEFTGSWLGLVGAGVVLSFLNFFLRPVVEAITFPIKLITLGLFSLVISMAMVWLVDIFFPQLIIPGLLPLFLTAAINWAIVIILALLIPKRKDKDLEDAV